MNKLKLKKKCNDKKMREKVLIKNTKSEYGSDRYDEYEAESISICVTCFYIFTEPIACHISRMLCKFWSHKVSILLIYFI